MRERGREKVNKNLPPNYQRKKTDSDPVKRNKEKNIPQWKILGKEEKIIKALTKQELEGVSIKEEHSLWVNQWDQH